MVQLAAFIQVPSMDSITTLRALSDIIAEAVTTVERAYKNADLNPPCLDEPLDPHSPAEALSRDPVVVDAVQNLVAAAAQISAATRDPAVSILGAANAFHISSCVQAATQLNVPEILRDAGPQGMSVKDIAAKNHVDPKLLARILRLLATHHIFREVSTDVFANNRISSTLDKGKSVEFLLANPDQRFPETTGLAALVEFITDEGFKAAGYMTETMLDPTGPRTGHMRAFRIDNNMFQWFEKPENKNRLTRFGVAMKGTATEEPAETIFRGFKWQDLPAGSIVVDVGGGLGASSLSIARRYPNLKVVNEDRPPVMEQSKAHWLEFFPEHLKAGMVEFQPHNFFEPQPVKNATVFLLRHILHDYADANATIILTHLRTAALSSTKLVIIEKIVQTACSGESTHPHVKNIPILGVPRKPAPSPLLANFGLAGTPPYYDDLNMNNLPGGEERTLEGFYDVLLQSGWKLVEVYNCLQTDSNHIIAEPIL
ncbi:S-adenosyl-L-methionine-dependent methyltransferase [Mycena sanguinolenta]|uniref:S-adenosyl-L-methionine-dependent methyltransferase n=1 Tax=Mycena sanguinolenta TaxID=230812 RepID=A0A8H7DDS5_9AGAR|nr:S-adenosyl-L-methionine-dependent methyltransferase [Mycena sanguinolenta]